MALFDHLKSREVAGKTKWLHVPQVCDSARLELLPASEVNDGYNSGMLKMAAARVRPSSTGRGRVDRGDQGMSRDDDRKLYPEYVIVNWEGILDTDGKEVPFSREAAAEFFQVLPNWIFDRIRLFCVVPENFLSDDQPTIDTQGLTGNSESDSAGS